MKGAGARRRVALAAVLCLYLQCVQCASFDCALSMESSTGTVQGTEVDLECALMPGNTQPVDKPVVLYDASLTIKRMTGDAFNACCRIRKGRTPMFALEASSIMQVLSTRRFYVHMPVPVHNCTCAAAAMIHKHEIASLQCKPELLCLCRRKCKRRRPTEH